MKNILQELWSIDQQQIKQKPPYRLLTSLMLLGVAVTDAGQTLNAVIHALHKPTEPLQPLFTKAQQHTMCSA